MEYAQNEYYNSLLSLVPVVVEAVKTRGNKFYVILTNVTLDINNFGLL